MAATFRSGSEPLGSDPEPPTIREQDTHRQPNGFEDCFGVAATVVTHKNGAIGFLGDVQAGFLLVTERAVSR